MNSFTLSFDADGGRGGVLHRLKQARFQRKLQPYKRGGGSDRVMTFERVIFDDEIVNAVVRLVESDCRRWERFHFIQCSGDVDHMVSKVCRFDVVQTNPDQDKNDLDDMSIATATNATSMTTTTSSSMVPAISDDNVSIGRNYMDDSKHSNCISLEDNDSLDETSCYHDLNCRHPAVATAASYPAAATTLTTPLTTRTALRSSSSSSSMPKLVLLSEHHSHRQRCRGFSPPQFQRMKRHYVQELDLSGSGLNGTGISAFADALVSNQTLKVLRLRFCGLNDDEHAQLVQALIVREDKIASISAQLTQSNERATHKVPRNSLEGLEIGQYSTGQGTLRKLGEFLSSRCCSLRWLKLRHQSLRGNDHLDLTPLTDALARTNKSNRKDDQSYQQTSHSKPSSCSLTSLDLSLSRLSNKNMDQLRYALVHNTTLKTLLLNHCNISNQGIQSFCHFLPQMFGLRRFECIGNHIDDHTSHEFLNAIQSNWTLEEISFWESEPLSLSSSWHSTSSSSSSSGFGSPGRNSPNQFYNSINDDDNHETNSDSNTTTLLSSSWFSLPSIPKLDLSSGLSSPRSAKKAAETNIVFSKELRYFLDLNLCGRRLLTYTDDGLPGNAVPAALWPIVLERADKKLMLRVPNDGRADRRERRANVFFFLLKEHILWER